MIVWRTQSVKGQPTSNKSAFPATIVRQPVRAQLNLSILVVAVRMNVIVVGEDNDVHQGSETRGGTFPCGALL
jgi:predicted nuclease of predicted toxin-antitoxin system